MLRILLPTLFLAATTGEAATTRVFVLVSPIEVTADSDVTGKSPLVIAEPDQDLLSHRDDLKQQLREALEALEDIKVVRDSREAAYSLDLTLFVLPEGFAYTSAVYRVLEASSLPEADESVVFSKRVYAWMATAGLLGVEQDLPQIARAVVSDFARNAIGAAAR